MTQRCLIPGDDVVVYNGDVPQRGRVIEGVPTVTLDLLFGGSSKRYTIDLGGEVRQVHPTVVAHHDDFREAWHVVDEAGRVLAGGPGVSENKARSLVDLMVGRGHPSAHLAPGRDITLSGPEAVASL